MHKSGLINQDEVWSGIVKITGDILIPGDVKVTVMPGTHLVFNSQTDYNVENVGSFHYQAGEIDVESARKELMNYDETSSIIINNTCKPKNSIDALKEEQLIRAFDEILNMPYLFQQVNLHALKLNSNMIASINDLKEMLSADKMPELDNIRNVNRAILNKMYPNTLKNSKDGKDNVLKYLSEISPREDKPNKSKCLIFVGGQIVLKGAKNNYIEIGNEGWDGFIVVGSKYKMCLEYCRIQNAYCGLTAFTETRISNCEFVENKYSITTTAEISMENNTIIRNEHGIICNKPGYLHLKGNNISNNRNTGIYCSAVDAFISNNIINNNKYGISLLNSNSNRIYNNIINENETAICINDGKNSEVKNNRMTNNIYNAVTLSLVESAKITYNKISESRCAIVCDRARNADVRYNVIMRTIDGLNVNGDSHCEINNNSISDVSNIAVQCTAVSSVKVYNNSLFDINFAIVGCDNSQILIKNNVLKAKRAVEAKALSQVTIIGNIINTEECGIKYIEQSEGKVENNKLMLDWIGTGMEICGMAEVEIKANDIDKARKGIELNDLSDVSINSNKILMDALGISVNDHAVGKIKSNILRGKDKQNSVGIAANGLSELEICFNKISDVEVGIKCCDETHSKIYHNELIKTKYAIEIIQLSEVLIDSNSVMAHDTGVVVNDHALGIIRNNIIKGNGGEKSVGITVDGLSDSEINNNIIKDVVVGIQCCEETYSKISDNKISAQNKYQYGYNIDMLNSTLTGDKQRYKFNVKLKAKNIVRTIVLRSYHFRLARTFYTMIYNLAIWSVKRSVGVIVGVKSIYLRRGMCYKDWVPGSSDIDLFVLTNDLSAVQEISSLHEIRKKYYKLKRIFPFLGEMQISNINELINYAKYGDIRAYELKSTWSLVYGYHMGIPDYEYIPEKLKNDCATEIINLYKSLTDIALNISSYINAKHLIIKIFIDIQKYSLFYRSGTVKIFSSRTEILEYISNESALSPEFKEFVDIIRNVWIKNQHVPPEFYSKIYLFTSQYIGQLFMNTVKPGVNNEKYDIYESETISKMNKVSYDCVVDVDRYCEGIRNQIKDALCGVIVDNPGMLYIVIKNEYYGKEEYLNRIYSVRDYIASRGNTKKTPFVILTNNIFQMLLLSNYMEMPFNYFKLFSNDKQIVCSAYEERWQIGLKRSGFIAPNKELLYLLIRETITIMSIGIKAINAVPFNKKQLIYYLNRVLSCRLALEKNIIAVPLIENVIECYGKQYPEEADDLEDIYLKYIRNTGFDGIFSLSSEMFEKSYPFISNILRKINANITEGICHYDKQHQRE